MIVPVTGCVDSQRMQTSGTARKEMNLWHNLVAICALILLCVAPVTATAGTGVGTNSVGANAHVATTAFADGVAEMGAGWIRLDGNWWALHPSPGTYHWQPLDDAVAAANDAGLNVLITFAYTPAWVPASGSDGNHLSDVPHGSDEWENFMRDAVQRYRDMGVRHYGIWNEPNMDQFFNGTVHDYIDTILLPGAGAVREVCADCNVVGPHLSSHKHDVDDFLRTILDEVGGQFFDIIAHHAFRGFAETGSNPWDRKFVNALDEPCDIPFVECADPLRIVLDEYDYDGEVWVAETGDRAVPGDPEEEDLQAIFVKRVLEEQAERPWYTNTFFYEIHDCGPDQPECGIDGFGLMRATGGERGSRTFPDDFRLKPSFYAIGQFIDDNPGFSHQPTTNDEAPIDVGSTDPGEQEQSGPTPLQEVTALHTRGMSLDADLTGFGDEMRVVLGAQHWHGLSDAGSDGTTVEAVLRWSSQNLYLGVQVESPHHHNDYDANELWRGDSLQIAFDTGNQGGMTYDEIHHHEFGFARSGSTTISQRFHGPIGASNDWQALVERRGNTTTYEIHLPAQVLTLEQFSVDQILGFSLLVNVADESGRLGWLELTPGIGEDKRPDDFASLYLAGESSGVEADSNAPGTSTEDLSDHDQSEADIGPSEPDSSDATGTDASTATDATDDGASQSTPGTNIEGSGSACNAVSSTPTGDDYLFWALLLAFGALIMHSRRPAPAT